MRTSALVLAMLVVVFNANSETLAQCENKQLAKLQVLNDLQFGQLVCIEGNTIVVRGAASVPTAYQTPYVFERVNQNQWQQVATLFGGSLGWASQFGYSIDVDGERIAVGAPAAVGQTGMQVGEVRIFTRVNGTWTHTSTISNPIASPPNQSLGDRVALDGPFLFAKRIANFVEVFSDASGTWSHVGTLTPPFPTGGSEYGLAMDIDGTVAAIAAGAESQTALGKGAVYVYEFVNGAWSPTAKLIPSTTSPYTFGTSVSVRGNRILVGALGGSVFVFEKIGVFWAQVATISSAEAGQFGQYGTNVSLGDDVAIVSSQELSVPGGPSHAGAVFVYERQGGSWIERLKLTANDPANTAGLGTSVALSGTEIVAGAPLSTPIGAAYVFNVVPNPIPTYGAGCAGSSNVAPELSMPMSYDGCKHAGESVSLAVTKGLGGSTCLLMIGASTASQTLPGGCPLLLIPSPANAVLPLFGSGPGNGSILVNATIPLGFPNVSLYMQGFIPDPGVPQGFSVTNGLRLTTY